MYIRRSAIKSRKDGGQYYTYRIVESRRTDTGVRQYTLLNLGADFSLPREKWSDLTRRIEDILAGQSSLFIFDNETEKLAQNIALRILQSRQDSLPAASPDYREVDIDSIDILAPRSVGAESAVLKALHDVELEKKLQELGFNGPQCAAAIGTIVGRACKPGSELATHEWLQQRSGLGELTGFAYSKLSLYGMYRISDQLLRNKEEIEEHFYTRERSLFNLSETITLYDLTNTYFEGQSKANAYAEFGHSKEKRTDCPLVTLALVLDSSGFPRRSQVYAGNVSEPGTLSRMLQDLEQGKRPTVVLDAGIASEENIDWLRKNHYQYIVVSRKRYREFEESESVIVKEDQESIVRSQKVVDEENKEVLLYCHSSLREKKEEGIQDRFTQRFEEELDKLAKGLERKGCLKKYDRVLVKIGRLGQKYSRVSGHYDITVEKDKKSENALKITWKKQSIPNSSDTYPGVYCLRSSQLDWDEKTLWETYTMLTDLEAVFRSLKSELGLRPVHHQMTERVSGHLFISVIAYHLVHALRVRLKQVNIHHSWSMIRNILSTQCRVSVSMLCKNGQSVHVRKSIRPEPDQQEIYTALGMKSYPGETIKSTV